ncbi:MAG: hypothetical protein HUU37_02230 [Bdellovibrionales bacterium]|nr:hypothetical protein [Bdellovibrionales bacterium]
MESSRYWIAFFSVLGVAAALFWLGRRGGLWVLRRMGARPFPPSALWNEVRGRAEAMAYSYRIPAPRVFFLPEYAPNAMILRDGAGAPILVVTEGLVQTLNHEELDAVLSFCMAQWRQKGFRRAVLLSLFFYPVLEVLEKLPRVFWFLFTPLISAAIRLVYRRKRVNRSDDEVVRRGLGKSYLAALQKMTVMARKLPMRQWSLAFDHLFVVAPLVAERFPFPILDAQPPVAERIERILRFHSLA